MIFWLVLALWLTAVIVPIGVSVWYQQGYRWLLLWEVIMFTPLLLLLGLIVLMIWRPIKMRNKDLYIPKVDLKDYLPRM